MSQACEEVATGSKHGACLVFVRIHPWQIIWINRVGRAKHHRSLVSLPGHREYHNLTKQKRNTNRSSIQQQRHTALALFPKLLCLWGAFLNHFQMCGSLKLRCSIFLSPLAMISRNHKKSRLGRRCWSLVVGRRSLEDEAPRVKANLDLIRGISNNRRKCNIW